MAVLGKFENLNIIVESNRLVFKSVKGMLAIKQLELKSVIKYTMELKLSFSRGSL